MTAYVSVLCANGGYMPPVRLLAGGGPAVLFDDETQARFSRIKWIDACSKSRVSFQGSALTANDRRKAALRNQLRPAFLNTHLQASVDQGLAAVEKLKEEGAKPEKLWTLDRQESGPVCVAEWMGY